MEARVEASEQSETCAGGWVCRPLLTLGAAEAVFQRMAAHASGLYTGGRGRTRSAGLKQCRARK